MHAHTQDSGTVRQRLQPRRGRGVVILADAHQAHRLHGHERSHPSQGLPGGEAHTPGRTLSPLSIPSLCVPLPLSFSPAHGGHP